MSQPIVIQLQELAADSKNEIDDLLRKALLVSTKLQLPEYKEWILSELNGYKSADAVPEYRIIHGDLRAENPFHGLVPFMIEDPELRDAVTRVVVHESVSSIQQMASAKKGTIGYYFGAEQEAALLRMQGGFAQLRPVRVVGANRLLAILATVRTRILEWALSLEAAGIVGHGLSFSEKEKSAAMNEKTIQIQNFQGVLGNVTGGSVTQTNSITITPGDFNSLASYLGQQGVPNSEILSLQEAISKDVVPVTPGKFGESVSLWLGKMMSLAASGSWEVSISTAGTLLAAAISKYYGL